MFLIFSFTALSWSIDNCFDLSCLLLMPVCLIMIMVPWNLGCQNQNDLWPFCCKIAVSSFEFLYFRMLDIWPRFIVSFSIIFTNTVAFDFNRMARYLSHPRTCLIQKHTVWLIYEDSFENDLRPVVVNLKFSYMFAMGAKNRGRDKTICHTCIRLWFLISIHLITPASIYLWSGQRCFMTWCLWSEPSLPLSLFQIVVCSINVYVSKIPHG